MEQKDGVARFEKFEKREGEAIKRLFNEKCYAACLGAYSDLGQYRCAVFYGLQGFYKVDRGETPKTLTVKEGLIAALKWGGFTKVTDVIARIKADAERIKSHKPW